MTDSADRRRRIGRIHRDRKAICQRLAVAPRVLGEKVFHDLERRGDAAILRELKRRWYTRSRELMREGWQVSPARRKYLVHCPPATCDVRGWTNPCDHQRICPFCYMRSYVALAYERLLAYLQHPVCRYFEPVLGISTMRWTMKCFPQAGVTELQVYKERLQRACGTKLPARICFMTMEPGEEPETLQLCIKNLLVLDVADPSEYHLTLPEYHRLEGPLTKTLVGQAVRALTDYPRWLFWGDATMTAKILGVCEYRKLRNIEFYGAVRPRRGLRGRNGSLD